MDSLRLAQIVSCLAVVGVLAGCGGGGNSGGGGQPPVNTNPPPPPPPPLPPLSIDAANARAIAHASIASSELALIIADEASITLRKLDGTSLYSHPWHCLNGTATYSLIDADQNDKLSIGDSAVVAYSDCQTDATNGVVRGDLLIDITDVDDSRGTDDVRYAGTASASAMSINRPEGQTMLNGSISFTFNRGVYEASVSASGSFAYRPPGASSMSLEWQDLIIEKVEDYETATYTVSIAGEIQFDEFEGTAAIESVQNLGGHLGTFPEDGILQVVSNDATKVRISVSPTQANSAQLSVDESGAGNFVDLPASDPWDDLSKRYLWWYELGPYSIRNIKTFEADDFTVLNRRPYDRGNLGSEPASVNPEIRLQMSRPVDPASVVSTAQMRLLPDEFPLTPQFVDVDVEVRGAIVFFRPTTQLSPGENYVFPIEGLWFSDYDGNVTSYGHDCCIYSLESIKSVVDPDELFGLSGDQVVLDASQSSSESNQNIAYLWDQILGPPVNISSANTQQTTIAVPVVGEPQLARIRLRSTNEYGEYDYAMTDISIYPDRFSTDVVVTRGLGYDGSHNETLYSSVNGAQTYSYNGGDYLKVENDTIYIISTGSSNNQFRHDLDISFGMPSGQTFEVGEYDVPANSSLSTPRLRIDGNEGCIGGGPGRFEIFEFQAGLQNEVERLAIDYTFECDPGYENTSVSGHIRLNSITPIPAAQ